MGINDLTGLPRIGNSIVAGDEVGTLLSGGDFVAGDEIGPFDPYSRLPANPLKMKAPGFTMPDIGSLLDMSVKQRIRTILHINEANSQNAEDDVAISTATKFGDEERANAEVARAKLEAAYERMNAPPPETEGVSYGVGDGIAALLGALFSGDAAASNNAMYQIATDRANRHNQDKQTRYQHDQNMAATQANQASRDLERSLSNASDWDKFKINRQDTLDQRLEKAQDKEEQKKITADYRTEKMHDGALDALRTATNPAQIPVLVAEVNRYREKLGIEPITPEEVASLSAEAGKRNLNLAHTRYQAIADEFSRRELTYGGILPDGLLDSYNRRVKALGDEFGVALEPLTAGNAPTMVAADKGADNTRADEAEKRMAAESAARIKKLEHDIAMDNKELAAGVGRWKRGEGPAPKRSEFDKTIAKLRIDQKVLKKESDDARAVIAKMPSASVRTPAQEKQLTDAQKTIADNKAKMADIERRIQVNAETRQEVADGEAVAPASVVGPINPPAAAAAPKPVAKPAPKPRVKPRKVNAPKPRVTKGGNTVVRE